MPSHPLPLEAAVALLPESARYVAVSGGQFNCLSTDFQPSFIVQSMFTAQVQNLLAF